MKEKNGRKSVVKNKKFCRGGYKLVSRRIGF